MTTTPKKTSPSKKTAKKKKPSALSRKKKASISEKTSFPSGLLITFEGSEGSGKSTQVSRLAQRLEKQGSGVLVTREPGGTELGEEIRRLLMHAASSENMTPEAEILLFAASRAQLVRESILPALKDGKTILCDRFLDSTTVYQGVGRRIATEPVHVINTFAIGELMPDVTIVLDVPAELGLRRIRNRATSTPNRMESESIDFYKKVREGYLLLAQAMPERFIVVDGKPKRDVIERKIWSELSQRLV